MPKNIIICFDGTGNEFGKNNSNVIKLYQMMADTPGQITYYHPGLGTMGSKNALSRIGKAWTKLIGLAFGYGISENIADGYRFLMNTYEEGDKIFLFGFSRGSYTARAFAGILRWFGLLTRGNDALIPYVIRMAKQEKRDYDLMTKFQYTFCVECKTHFLGLWDTVSSVGWVYNAVTFPSTFVNPDLNIVRHAMSIDERRAFFRQNLFAAPDAKQDFVQKWFAGVHSDVGGGYPDDVAGLSNIALWWMVRESEPMGLLLDQAEKAKILAEQQKQPLPKAVVNKSLHGFWWIAEIFPKFYYKKFVDNGKTIWKKRIRMNLGRRRYIDCATAVLDDSVKERMMQDPNYRPNNIKPLWP